MVLTFTYSINSKLFLILLSQLVTYSCPLSQTGGVTANKLRVTRPLLQALVLHDNKDIKLQD